MVVFIFQVVIILAVIIIVNIDCHERVTVFDNALDNKKALALKLTSRDLKGEKQSGVNTLF